MYRSIDIKPSVTGTSFNGTEVAYPLSPYLTPHKEERARLTDTISILQCICNTQCSLTSVVGAPCGGLNGPRFESRYKLGSFWSLRTVKPGSGNHPASYSMGTAFLSKGLSAVA